MLEIRYVKAFALRAADVVVGSNALSAWRGVLDWNNRTVKIGKEEVKWKVRKQPHWRHPVTLTTDDNYQIPPGHSMVVGTQQVHPDQMWGRKDREGLFTPVRTKLRLDQQFLVGYGHGELNGKVILFNPGAKPLIVRKGSQIAEFHPGVGVKTIAQPTAQTKESATQSTQTNKSEVQNTNTQRDNKRFSHSHDTAKTTYHWLE